MFLARDHQVKKLVMTQVLGGSSCFNARAPHLSTNTSDQRGGKDHHVSGKEDGRKTAR
jgi:hypothetical protein